MVALWAEVKRTGVTGREAHGCPCPPIKGRVARQQLLKSERGHVCVCVCVCAPPAALAYGLSVGTRSLGKFPRNHSSLPTAYHRHGTGPPEEESQKETMRRKKKNYTPGWKGNGGGSW